MMRELFLKTVVLEDAKNVARKYDYFILIDEPGAGVLFCESYGIRVAEQGSGEECRIPHITTSMSRIDELAELVTNGGVTPVTLPDVVADWL